MDGPDPLGVLASTRLVVEEAKHVRIDRAKVEAVAEELGCVFKGVVTLGDEPRPRTDRRAVGGAGTAPAAAAGRDRA
ncbi:MAG: hypothetical protein M3Q03_21150, partial [Chloroflexota bacterium]|nr:hypothetical protein [Chloroflexota bacterium]